MKITRTQYDKLFDDIDDGIQGDLSFNAFLLSEEHNRLPKGASLEDITCAVDRFFASDAGAEFDQFVDQVGPHVALIVTELLLMKDQPYKIDLERKIAGVPGGILFAGRILIRVDGQPESDQDLAKRLRNDRFLRMKGFESIRFAQAEVEKDATGCAKACISLAKKLGRERKAVLMIA